MFLHRVDCTSWRFLRNLTLFERLVYARPRIATRCTRLSARHSVRNSAIAKVINESPGGSGVSDPHGLSTREPSPWPVKDVLLISSPCSLQGLRAMATMHLQT